MKGQSTSGVAVAALLATLGLAACGGGDASDPSTGPDASGPGTIGLRVTTPNGDPVSGATVFIPGGSTGTVDRTVTFTDSKGNTCAGPPSGAPFAACTDAAGMAVVGCDGTGDMSVRYVKGSFSGSTQARCGAVETVNAAFEMTGAARMAVATGNYDRMQDVLAKIGYGQVDEDGLLVLGSEQFKLYDGDETLGDGYRAFADVLLDPSELATNDILFINCDDFGLGAELDGQTDAKLANLGAFVNNGGKLYVTDLSYDYIEQAFPGYIRFAGSPASGSTPEEPGAAEIGSEPEDPNAKVNDAGMAAWLRAVKVNTGQPDVDCGSTQIDGKTGALNADGSIFIADLLGGWAEMEGVESSPPGPVKRWIDGTALEGADRPLTITFDVGSKGGRVLYTSYHTADSCPSKGFWPQERVLQFLVTAI